MHLKLSKCSFAVPSVEYLGMIVSENKMEMDPAKLSAIVDWVPPHSVKAVRSFIGFCNFYRKFIPDFSTTARPLHDLTKKGATWSWTTECQKAFDTIKEAFLKKPVLAIPDVAKPFTIMTDASLTATGGVLMQNDSNGDLHPCAYFSKTLSPAERNYDIYDRELLAIMHALHEWRHYLQGTGFPVKVLTDHKNLMYFKQPHKLSR